MGGWGGEGVGGGGWGMLMVLWGDRGMGGWGDWGMGGWGDDGMGDGGCMLFLSMF